MSSIPQPASVVESDAQAIPVPQAPLPPTVRLPTAALPPNLYAVVPSLALLTLGFGAADLWDLVAQTNSGVNGHRPK